MSNRFYRFVGRNCSLIIAIMFLTLACSNCAVALFAEAHRKMSMLEALYQFQLSMAWFYIYHFDRSTVSA